MSYEIFKKPWYHYLFWLILIPFLFSIWDTILGTLHLGPKIAGTLTVKENSAIVRQLPFLSCDASSFGVMLYTKDKEAIFISKPFSGSKEQNFSPDVDYYQPPDGARYYGPCQFSRAVLKNKYHLTIGAFINNMLSPKGIFLEKGAEYWSGSVEAICQEQNNRQITISANFKNCWVSTK